MNQLETALAHHEAGRLDAAIACYRAVLDQDPHHSDALHMMGVIAQQRGNSALALKLIEAALAINPALAGAWSNRATILRVLLRTDDALESAQKALTLDPLLGDAWDMAGSLLRQQKKYVEARDCHEKALQLQPHNRVFRSNFAVLLLTLGDIRKAFDMASGAGMNSLETNDLPLIFGNILQAAGYPQQAITYYHKNFENHPQLLEAHINEALAYLKIGDFDQGFALWQARHDGAETTLGHIPKWQGTNISQLLLYEDQGLGDALQMIRYLPMVKERVSEIFLYLETPALTQLFTNSFPDIKVIAAGEHIPVVDARCQLMSLPFIFGTTLATIPQNVPYLRARAESDSFWLDKMSSLHEPRIGLVWAGNINYPNDRNRSIPFEQLTPLLQAGRGHFVSLQKGPQKLEVDFVTHALMDTDLLLDNFAATAGLIHTLDLVITVDTSVAHLAGALGKPVWVLLPFDPDWRWMLEREDSPWYPTMRLFRQIAPRDWTTALEKISKDLKLFIDGDSTVLKPSIWTGLPLTQNKNALPLWD